MTRGFLGVFRYSRRALELVWTTSRPLTIALAALTLVAGLLPAAIAWVGAQIVDAVVAAAAPTRRGARRGRPRRCSSRWSRSRACWSRRWPRRSAASRLCQSLLRAQLGQRVNVMILEKALTLSWRSSRTPSSTTS